MNHAKNTLPRRLTALGATSVAALGLSLLSACVAPPSVQQPEAASGLNTKPGWTFQRQAVAAAN
ncbi:MAG: hypothetical protein Q8S02_16510, partial [Hydrogenophaga sp.]|nr:hypothetical protein [Hydrogenophaga sp.]